MEDIMEYYKAAIIGIKQFGVSKALTALNDNHKDINSTEDGIMNIAMLVALIVVIFPELCKDSEFMKLMALKIMSIDKDTLDARCDAVLNALEGGNL